MAKAIKLLANTYAETEFVDVLVRFPIRTAVCVRSPLIFNRKPQLPIQFTISVWVLTRISTGSTTLLCTYVVVSASVTVNM